MSTGKVRSSARAPEEIGIVCENAQQVRAVVDHLLHCRLTPVCQLAFPLRVKAGIEDVKKRGAAPATIIVVGSPQFVFEGTRNIVESIDGGVFGRLGLSDVWDWNRL